MLHSDTYNNNNDSVCVYIGERNIRIQAQTNVLVVKAQLAIVLDLTVK